MQTSLMTGASLLLCLTLACSKEFPAPEPPLPPKLEQCESFDIVDTYVREESSELVLEYRTTRKLMAEHEAVQREVERMWEEFLRQEAERLGVQQVSVLAEEKYLTVHYYGGHAGLGQASVSFVLRKDSAGEWHKENGFAWPPPN